MCQNQASRHTPVAVKTRPTLTLCLRPRVAEVNMANDGVPQGLRNAFGLPAYNMDPNVADNTLGDNPDNIFEDQGTQDLHVHLKSKRPFINNRF